MSSYSLTHVSDPDLVRGLTSAVAQDRSATVVVAGPPCRVRCAAALRPGGVPLDLPVLRARAAPLGRRGIQAHPGGACGTAVPGHLRRLGPRSPASHGGEPAGSPPDARE